MGVKTGELGTGRQVFPQVPSTLVVCAFAFVNECVQVCVCVCVLPLSRPPSLPPPRPPPVCVLVYVLACVLVIAAMR